MRSFHIAYDDTAIYLKAAILPFDVYPLVLEFNVARGSRTR